MRNKHKLWGVLVLLAQGGWAQTLPSAGGQLQQIPSVPAPAGSVTPLEVRPVPAPAVPAGADTVFTAQTLRVTGASVYDEAELVRVSGFVPGQALGLQALHGMAERITQHYRQNGFLVARAYLPAQQILDGVVTLAVLEGRYGEVKLLNSSALDHQVPRELLTGLHPGEVIAAAPLEERLLLLSEVPGVQVRSSLVPGSRLGLSDLVVNVSPGDRISGSVDMDNAGNRYTGENRIGATLHVNNPTGRGDLASLRVLTSGSGLRYGRGAYQLPVGRGQVGLAYSDLAYRLDHEFEAVGANGHARSASLFGTYPLWRSRQGRMSLGWTLETKRFEDRLDALPTVTRKRAQVAVASLFGDQRDRLGGGGWVSYSVAWSHGVNDIRTPAARAVDADTARSNGHYNKLAFTLSRLQRVSDSLSFFAGLSGQTASKNLDVSEKMELGGMYGVRAYPEGEAYADEGYLLTLEARQQLRMSARVPGQVQLAAFMDTGRVRINHRAWTTDRAQRELIGAGVGAYWSRARDFSVKAFYARKLGSEDALSAPDKSGRVWLQAVKYF